MKIIVTQEDIQNGRHNDPWCCPIANAANRAFGERVSESTPLSVTDIYISFVDSDTTQRVVYSVPRTAKKFIHRFDNDLPVEEISFVSRPRK